MEFLVLGGTSFVGRHFVDAALDGGHDITLFNRGQTNADLFPNVEKIHGDRYESELDGLKTGEWDAVIDVNGYVPRHVQESADLLKGRVGTYCFISTGSVYSELNAPGIDEDAPLASLDDPTVEEVTNESYGGLKVLCERIVLDGYGDHGLIVRPGIVAGPHDPTDRFTYWVRRMARGGKVLGPPRPDQPVQVVHARDQGDFILSLVASATPGVFNSVGPDDPATLGELIEACRQAAGTTAEVVWTPEEFLREHQVNVQLALPASGEMDGIFRISNERGKANGLRNRSLTDTAADTLAWDKTRGDSEMPGSPTAEREAELLAKL
jgi:2'-hydroxyisoflavone reductase